jgi:hypothetical protein
MSSACIVECDGDSTLPGGGRKAIFTLKTIAEGHGHLAREITRTLRVPP